MLTGTDADPAESLTAEYTRTHVPSATHIEVIARGVLIRNGTVLVCRDLTHGYAYLPGGHVEFGESSMGALARELDEETGLACTVGPLLLAAELRFNQRGTPRHELSLVFHVERLGPGNDPPEDVPSREGHIAFEWLDLGALADADVRPEVIRAWLAAGGRSDTAAADWISVDERPA